MHLGGSMKVNNNSSQLAGIENAKSNALNKTDKEGKSNPLGEAKDLGSSAKVNVSEKAHEFQKAKDIASGTEVNDEKVERLQKLIDAGQYKVDAKAVADRLVDEHLKINN